MSSTVCAYDREVYMTMSRYEMVWMSGVVSLGGVRLTPRRSFVPLPTTNSIKNGD
jgi:hypothetical protein